MRLLVTGGAGYIGSVVAAQLLEAGHDVVVLDDLSTGHADAVPAGAELVVGSVADPGEALGRGVDAVLHFAGTSLVGESVQRPELYWHTNVVGTRLLLDAMRVRGVRRIVFSSTAATYGVPQHVPVEETEPAAPTNPYGASKLAVDHMLSGEAAAYDLAAVSLRYFNVAGAWRGFGERHATETHLIPIALQVAAGRRERLSIYGDDYPTPDGTCVRDYIHVADLSQAHLLALEAPQPGQHLVYNLGNGAGFSVRQVVDVVREVTGHPVPVEVAPRRPGDPPVLVASSRRAQHDLGWTPQRQLAAMVSDAWELARSLPD
ncbi:UDP-glucose 4-epimerase GalE [Quadrisphaera sp. GCM10027208]|uniref:UDP-glucose 4-epimerase GalE n=1 Tax=Quadrisphaera sp. GCM10027208 TaxID=3273423 RepID=UPI00361616CB